MVEYALMLTLISVVALGATRQVGVSVRDVYGIVQTALANVSGGGDGPGETPTDAGGGSGGGNSGPSNGHGDGNGGGNGPGGGGNSGCGVMC